MRIRAALVGAIAAVALTIAPAGQASGGSFGFGFADDLLADPDGSTRAGWQDKAVAAGAEIVRVNLPWRSVVGPTPPADAADPADPAYDFSRIDATAADAEARGLELMLTVYSAPDWAEGSSRDGKAVPGTWRPRPTAVGEFATALATRYSGNFGSLPRIRYLQAWNEPNLERYLTPAWKGSKPVAADHYRKMLSAFHRGVRASGAGTEVVTAGTAPYGEEPGGGRIRPLEFWRSVFCLDDDLGPARCVPRRERARFDVFSHHAINTSGGPNKSAYHPDDATSADFKAVRKTLEAAERRGRALGARDHPLWSTEFWWESDPPDRRYGTSLRSQAKRIALTGYLLWRQQVEVAILIQIRDAPLGDRPDVTLQSGVYFEDGTAKPALEAVRFPFVVDRRRTGKLIAWAVAPRGGKLTIERRAGTRWRKLDSLRVDAGEVVARKLRLRGAHKLRATVGSERSLSYGVKRR